MASETARPRGGGHPRETAVKQPSDESPARPRNHSRSDPPGHCAYKVNPPLKLGMKPGGAMPRQFWSVFKRRCWHLQGLPSSGASIPYLAQSRNWPADHLAAASMAPSGRIRHPLAMCLRRKRVFVGERQVTGRAVDSAGRRNRVSSPFAALRVRASEQDRACAGGGPERGRRLRRKQLKRNSRRTAPRLPAAKRHLGMLGCWPPAK